MAKCKELDRAAWDEWVASRPLAVKDLCARIPPDRLYRMKSTGKRVTIDGYDENGTVIVAVTGRYNVVLFDRHVFGVNPEDLEECDLPGDSEALGTVMADRADVRALLDAVRPAFDDHSGGLA